MMTKDENGSPVTLSQMKSEFSQMKWELKSELRSELAQQFVKFYNELIEPRFQRVDDRFDRIEVRLDGHDGRFDDLYKKFEGLQIRRLSSN